MRERIRFMLALGGTALLGLPGCGGGGDSGPADVQIAGAGTWTSGTVGGFQDGIYSPRIVGSGNNAWVLDRAGNVLRTTDGGRNWAPLTNVSGIKTLQLTGNTLWAGGDSPVDWLKKSTNGGNSWTTVQAAKVMVQQFSAASADIVWLFQSGFVFRTLNGGASMETAQPAPADYPMVRELSPLDGTNAWGRATNGGAGENYRAAVIRTSDGGKSWKTFFVGTTTTFAGNLLQLSPVDATTAWCIAAEGGIPRLYRSTDGETFNRALNSDDIFAQRIVSYGARQVSVLGTDPVRGFGVYETQDAGSNWKFTPIPLLMGIAPPISASMSPGVIWVMGGDGKFYKKS